MFRLLMGEPLNAFIKRVRLERAVSLLAQVDERGRTRLRLTDIALSCGFNSSSDFSRSFKQQYGVPPRAFDFRSFRQQRREDWAEAITDETHRRLLAGLAPGENPDGFAVAFRELPARHVVYRRIVDSYREGVAWRTAESLVEWAEARGLADGQWLGYAWDDPEIVPIEKCRYDVGLVVPEPILDESVGCLRFPPMQVAELEIRGGIDLEVRALDWLFATWLPSSGLMPSDQPVFEAWIGRPWAHGNEHFELHLQFPVMRV